MELMRNSLFDFDVKCLWIKYKQKQIKMVTKLDGSEESMLPVLIKNSNELFSQKTKKNIVNIRRISLISLSGKRLTQEPLPILLIVRTGQTAMSLTAQM
jgi:hypothetical protein